jgi:hypothetical protein
MAEKWDAEGEAAMKRPEWNVPILAMLAMLSRLEETVGRVEETERSRDTLGWRNGRVSLDGVPFMGESVRGGVMGVSEDVEGVVSDRTSLC